MVGKVGKCGVRGVVLGCWCGLAGEAGVGARRLEGGERVTTRWEVRWAGLCGGVSGGGLEGRTCSEASRTEAVRTEAARTGTSMRHPVYQ